MYYFFSYLSEYIFWKYSLSPLIYVYSVLIFICFLAFPVVDFLQLPADPRLSVHIRVVIKRRSEDVSVCVWSIFIFVVDRWAIYKMIWQRLGFFLGGNPKCEHPKISLVPWFLQKENAETSLAIGIVTVDRERGMVFHYSVHGHSLNVPFFRIMPQTSSPLCSAFPTSKVTLWFISLRQ